MTPEREVFRLVGDDEPAIRIVIGARASATEKHAAEELAKYLKLSSGAICAISTQETCDPNDRSPFILIGRSETNTLVKHLIERRLLRLSSDYPGLDGFAIKTVGNALVLGGSRDRGTLYTVYHFLEKFLHVGFFCDGDAVPKLKSIRLPKIDLAERPRLKVRWSFDVAGCVGSYSYGRMWSVEDYQKHLDWLAKHKFNTTVVDIEKPIVDKLVEERLGLGARPLIERDHQVVTFARRIFDYLRLLDLDAVTPFPGTEVSADFVNTFPNGRYFRQGCFYSLEQNNPQPLPANIFPADPLYRRLVKTYIDTWTELFGTWHQYLGAGPYSESAFETSEEEKREIMLTLPRATLQALLEADPQALWHYNDWGWVFNYTCAWSKEIIHKFLANNVPRDRVFIWNDWCEWTEWPLWMSDKTEAFLGRPFGLAFLNEFGGDDYFRGDIPKSIAIVKKLAKSRKARNGVGAGLVQEVLYYNLAFYDFVCRLAWNPADVGYEAGLKDYALRRYGAKGLAQTARLLKLLAETVHRQPATSMPFYQHRLYAGRKTGVNYPNRFLPANWCLKTARKLERILRKTLSLPLDVRANHFLQNDLVDVFRQYVAELFNVHTIALHDAFEAGKSEEFERHARAMLFLLEQLTQVLSSRSEWRFEDIARRLASNPLNGPLEDVRRTMRRGLSFASDYEFMVDYGGRDYYEAVRHYYGPRVRVFIDALRTAMRQGKTPTKEELDISYRRVERAWDDEGYSPDGARPFPAEMWQAVKMAYEKIEAAPDVRVRPSDVRIRVGPTEELSLTLVDGNNQRGKVGQKPAKPLTVRLQDRRGRGASGFMIDFDVLQGRARFGPVSTTDFYGRAQTDYTPQTPGKHIIRVSSTHGRRTRVVFRIHVGK